MVANYPTSTAANGIWSMMDVRNNAIGKTWPGYFRPTQLSNCAAWFDAADMSTFFQNSNGTTAAQADSDPIGYWQDKSGNGRHATQSTNASRPVLKVNQVNSRPAVQFDGSASHFRSTLSLGSAHSVFFVTRPRIRKIGVMLNGAYDYELMYGDADTFGGNNFAAYANGYAVYSLGAITTGVFQVATYVLSGGTLPGNLSGWTNGTGGAATVGTAGTAPTANMSANTYIGRSAAVGVFAWDGLIAEIICYSRALSTAERQEVERYLGWKHGISVV